ncbi:MAG: DUF2892 domain-containing protein [Thiobacillaceae bacterium]|nr:DUF2892 domain-containing protein [Thiobacillaceae bacterium]MCX7672492.1 DUF2892 domain-containing protein [Thiobacillaceae bacterium]MDW8324566.1 DUF2892 domain-containing protein [Burkholderiales bacterium]
MTCNVGTVDRILRIVVGLGLVIWALAGGPMWAWIGLAPLITGAIGWCPVYFPFGLSTCKPKDSQAAQG